MSIDLKIISDLRERTGAGVSDCQKALIEANGQIELAIEILRKKGEIKAAKKSDRATKEGLVALARGENKVAAVVLSCETDFVSRNSDFQATTQSFADKLLSDGTDGFAAWAEGVIKNELVVKIGENIKLSDFGIIESPIIGSYLHANKKVAGVVALVGGNQELANEIAMQVAAMSPRYIKSEDVAKEEIDKEVEIYREQLKNEGKPENLWEKIITGKLAKYYEEICLLDQIYIKDDSKKISDLIADAGVDSIKEFKKFQA